MADCARDQFIEWIADRFISKHATPLDRHVAVSMARGTLECIESDGATFGHPDYGWTEDDAHALADDEIETCWESAP